MSAVVCAKQDSSETAPALQGNLALKISMDLKTPVRVCRAAAMQERDGHNYRMYAYEGLYLVMQMT